MSVRDEFAAQLMRESYAAYCYFVHGGKWTPSKLHTYLANKVQEFIEIETGNPYDILIISTPPQHGKSMTVTETLPSWYIGNNSDRRCMIICYNEDFAGRFGRRNRAKIDEYGQYIFGIKTSKSTDRDIEIAGHSGSVIARGVMSGITGRSGDLIVIDDPIKNRQEADSATYRDRLWEEWLNSIKSRTQAGSKIIIIQTRWHEDDLAGRVIEREPYVEVVNLPVEAEEDDVLGREPGEALCPEIGKDNAWLQAFKAGYKDGSRAWYALYQGHPVVEGGNLVKREWWQYYDEISTRLPLISISVDAAFKDTDTSDYVAIEVWGRANADYYLLDMIHQRMDFPDTVRAIRHMADKYPDKSSILIEDKANGSAIISVLRHEIPGIVAITPKESKTSRVNAVSGIIEAGNVYLPKYADFTDAFVDEFSAFPAGKHDDMVDAATQFLNKYKFYKADVKDDTRTELDKQLAEWKKSVIGGHRRRKLYG